MSISDRENGNLVLPKAENPTKKRLKSILEALGIFQPQPSTVKPGQGQSQWVDEKEKRAMEARLTNMI